jgi:hypothetical protein
VAPVFPLAAPVAGQHEHARRADRVPGGDVGELVADHHRGGQVEAELGRRPVQQARPRLAAVAVGAIRRLTLARMVHAHVHAVEPRPGRAELVLHPRVGGVQGLLREVAARDAGLVGDHHRRHAGLVQATHRLRGARQEADPGRVVDVPHLLGEAAVPVHEDGGAWRAAIDRH